MNRLALSYPTAKAALAATMDWALPEAEARVRWGLPESGDEPCGVDGSNSADIGYNYAMPNIASSVRISADANAILDLDTETGIRALFINRRGSPTPEKLRTQRGNVSFRLPDKNPIFKTKDMIE